MRKAFELNVIEACFNAHFALEITAVEVEAHPADIHY